MNYFFVNYLFRNLFSAKLISEYDHMDPENQRKATESCQKFRLMVSGSMALPVSVRNFP